MSKIKYLSLFTGIGSFEKALRLNNIEFDLVGFSEIDKYAIKSYCAIHNIDEKLNLGDITKIDETKLPKVDLLTYGFPCQDISVAGSLKGLEHEGKKTRSGLVWDAIRIIKATQPKIAIAENVKMLVSEKFKKEFTAILQELESAGYHSYWEVFNAKDYDIPQNRERVFFISVRKDLDNLFMMWEQTRYLEKRLLDYLEENVDEKYFISEKTIKSFLCKKDRNGFVRAKQFTPIHSKTKYANTITTKSGTVVTDNYVLIDEKGEIYNPKENFKVLSDYLDKHLIIKTDLPGNKAWKFKEADMPRDIGVIVMNQARLRIRKITPRESYRLMGFTDDDFDKAKSIGTSDSQLYKQAGNSIVVDVARAVLRTISHYLKGEKRMTKGEIADWLAGF